MEEVKQKNTFTIEVNGEDVEQHRKEDIVQDRSFLSPPKIKMKRNRKASPPILSEDQDLTSHHGRSSSMESDGSQYHTIEQDGSRGEELQVYTKAQQKGLTKIVQAFRDAVYENKEERRMLAIIENEWVDPTPDFVEGIFKVNQTNICMRCCSTKRSSNPDKIQIYDYRSLYCLHFQNPVRVELVNLTSSTNFENFIILSIFINSIVLAIYDYNDRENETAHNQILELIGNVLTILFTIEMVLKILAQGFILHHNAYLRDAWNWLDFIVVITGIMEMMQLRIKMNAIRTLRVLRPLRSIKAFPKMRLIISSLVGSVSSLLNAVIFMLFIFMLFGILGIQQFQGTMYNRCRFTEFPLDDGTWPIDENFEFLCSPDGQGQMECPQDRFCKQPADASLPASIDFPINQELIFYNLIGFDNLAWAMLTIFQMITLEQWTTVMYLLMDSNIWWMAVLFCVTLILIGSFFLLNVILAVLADGVNMQDQWRIKHDGVRLAQVMQSLERAETQKSSLRAGNLTQNVKMKLGKVGVLKNQDNSINSSDNQNNEMALKQSFEISAIDIAKEERQIPNIRIVIASNQVSSSESDQFSYEQSDSSLSRPSNDKSEQGAEEKSEPSERSIQSEDAFTERIEKLEFADVPNQSHLIQKMEVNITKRSNSTLRKNRIQQLPDRTINNRIYQTCYRICTHWSFTFVITLLIVGNTAVLALDGYPEDPQTTKIARSLNEVFTVAFAVEMIIKILGLGFRMYARDTFNLFDALIVILSVVDLVVSKSLHSDDSPTGALSAFRGVRLLRVFKLARSWKNFRQILAKILTTMKDVSIFSVLMILFILIFSLLGMELFGYKVLFHRDIAQYPGDPDYDQALAPRPNFNDLGMSVTMIFAVAIGDDWNYFMAMAYRAEGFIAIFFYPVVFIFMNLVLLNLFLAILLHNFEQKEEHHDEDEQNEAMPDEFQSRYFQQRSIRRARVVYNRCSQKLSCCFTQDEEKADTITIEQDQSSSISSVDDCKISSAEFNQQEKQDNQTVSEDLKLGQLPTQRIQNIQVKPMDDDSEHEGDKEWPATTIDQPAIAVKSTLDANNRVFPIGQSVILSSKESVTDYSKVKTLSFKSAKVQKRTKTENLIVSCRRASQAVPPEYNPQILRKVIKEMKMGMQKKGIMHKQKVKQLEQSSILMATGSYFMSQAAVKKMELIEKKGDLKKEIVMIGRSLFCFSKTNFMRKVCYKIVKHAWYDTLVLIMIAFSTILLTLDNPNMNQNGQLADVLSILDYVLTTAFTIECLVNIILFGLICNGTSSYARDPWNIMDITIVIFSILTIILAGQGGADLSILKIFRMLRVLRPLRFLKRNLGLKIQVISLLNSIPGIGNLLMIALLILMLFSIQAVGLLKGTFFYCETDNVPEYAIPFIKTKWDCLDYGGEWINQEDNFDNVLVAMVTMFGMMTTEGWLEVMWNAVDSTQINQVPERNNQLPFIGFFVVFMVVGSLFILNLFVGVVINTFNIEKEKLSRNSQMTDLQNEYASVLIQCYSVRPLKLVVQSGNKCHDSMLRVVQHQAFEVFIFACICFNTVVLALSWYGMDQQIIDVLEILNYIFTVIYTIEMVIKMIAFGSAYFKDSWCLFDFSIVLSAWIGLILLKGFNIDVGSISTIIRSFRIARVLKLIKTAKNLQQIFQTFILAIPELVNTGALLLLFLFLFGVLGVSLFAEVKLQGTLNRNANFESFGRAILTLLRVSTGEGWVGIMRDAARQPSIMFQCIEDQTYDSKVKDGIQGCGNSAAYLYFVAFILMVSLVFLNLFIAIILEGFAASASAQKIRISEECFEVFQLAWRKYDPNGTQLIQVKSLESLILDLIEEEMRIIGKNPSRMNVNFDLHHQRVLKYYTKWTRNLLDEEDRKGYFQDIENNKPRQLALRRYMRSYIAKLHIPLYDGMQKVQFHDTMNGILLSLYQKFQQDYVDDRENRIQTKKRVGEKLVGLEGIEVGSEEFWKMHPILQEVMCQRTEPEFQKVVNRLENKGNSQGEEILKLKFMRQLRKKAGARFRDRLSLDKYEQVYDSSHYIGACIISKYIRKFKKSKILKLKNTNDQQQEISAAEQIQSSIKVDDEKTLPPAISAFIKLEDKIPKVCLGFRNQVQDQKTYDHKSGAIDYASQQAVYDQQDYDNDDNYNDQIVEDYDQIEGLKGADNSQKNLIDQEGDCQDDVKRLVLLENQDSEVKGKDYHKKQATMQSFNDDAYLNLGFDSVVVQSAEPLQNVPKQTQRLDLDLANDQDSKMSLNDDQVFFSQNDRFRDQEKQNSPMSDLTIAQTKVLKNKLERNVELSKKSQLNYSKHLEMPIRFSKARTTLAYKQNDTSQLLNHRPNLTFSNASKPEIKYKPNAIFAETTKQNEKVNKIWFPGVDQTPELVKSPKSDSHNNMSRIDKTASKSWTKEQLAVTNILVKSFGYKLEDIDQEHANAKKQVSSETVRRKTPRRFFSKSQELNSYQKKKQMETNNRSYGIADESRTSSKINNRQKSMDGVKDKAMSRAQVDRIMSVTSVYSEHLPQTNNSAVKRNREEKRKRQLLDAFNLM